MHKTINDYRQMLKVLDSIADGYEQELNNIFVGKRVQHRGSSDFFNYGESTITSVYFDSDVFFLVTFPGCSGAEYFSVNELVFIDE